MRLPDPQGWSSCGFCRVSIATVEKVTRERESVTLQTSRFLGLAFAALVPVTCSDSERIG